MGLEPTRQRRPTELPRKCSVLVLVRTMLVWIKTPPRRYRRAHFQHSNLHFALIKPSLAMRLRRMQIVTRYATPTKDNKTLYIKTYYTRTKQFQFKRNIVQGNKLQIMKCELIITRLRIFILRISYKTGNATREQYRTQNCIA